MPFPAKTTPDAILQAALEMLSETGLEGLSLRNLATRLKIKAPSLYRHFADRAALEAALVTEGATRLHAQLEGIQAKTPQSTVKIAANRYLDFATENPALYQLMNQPLRSGRQYTPSGSPKALWNLMLDMMSAVTGNPDDTAATVSLWAFLHGYISLERSGAFGESGPRGAFQVGLDALLAGFTARRAASRGAP
jgi:AcrR family transcriptional regulator